MIVAALIAFAGSRRIRGSRYRPLRRDLACEDAGFLVGDEVEGVGHQAAPSPLDNVTRGAIMAA